MTKEDLIELKKKIASLSDEEKKERDLYLRKIALGEIQGPQTGYASIDKPWLKYYSENINRGDIPSMSMIQYAQKVNENNLNQVALELKTSANNFGPGIKITYKDFFSRINQTASALKKSGVKEGDIVCTILPNIPESRIIIYALNTIGAVAYPINFMLPSQGLKQIVDENNVKTVFIFSQFYEKFKDVLKSSNVENIIYLNGKESLSPFLKRMINLKDMINGKQDKTNIEGVTMFDDFYKTGDSKKVDFVYKKDSTAIIVGTSGTTGVPKGVKLSNENLNAIAIQHIDSGAYVLNSVLLDILIQSIAYGVTAMHAATCAGFYTEIIPELVTDQISKVLTSVKPSPDYFIGGPVHANNIASSEEFENGKIRKLKHFVSGGASLDKKVEEKLNGVSEGYAENGRINESIFVRNGFGASENGGCGTFAVEGSYKFGGIGIPLPLDTFSIFELGTENELSYNQVGEICVSGPTIMQGYLNNPNETNIVLKTHSDGTKWVHLADIGYIDSDGQLYHLDRAKNLFMRTGFNIHPSKIKEFILNIPFVKNCTVIGFSHPKEQMVPVAFIEFNQDIDPSEYNEKIELIKKLCYENLDELYIPCVFCIVNSMPLNLGGKIVNNKLVEESGIDFNSHQYEQGTIMTLKLEK